jgi:hypothetical protein
MLKDGEEYQFTGIDKISNLLDGSIEPNFAW